MPEAIIPLVNQYLATLSDHPAPDWQALSTGSSNRLWYGEWAGRAHALRLNASTAVAFGVDRQREAALLVQLNGLPWMPAIVHNNLQQGWLLMHWHGDVVKKSLTVRQQQQLLDAVTQWQQIALDDARLLIDYQALFMSFLPGTAALPMAQPLEKLIRLACERVQRLPVVPQCIVHHDIHPGNLCDDGTQLVVLDWEYGAVGNPWFDVAALHYHCELTETQLAGLPCLRMLTAAQMKQGLSEACWLLDTLEVLWYWVRGLQGSELTIRDLMQRTVQLLR